MGLSLFGIRTTFGYGVFYLHFDFYCEFSYNYSMVLERLREEKMKFRKEVKDKTVGYILAALGLVAGLAWNEAIKALITVFFPTPGNDVLAKFVYAVLVTIIIVIITVYLLKITSKPEVKN